jgi:hypothetical protein
MYGPFRKREAQTWFRMDVNKICVIYDWFKALGWIPEYDQWEAHVNKKDLEKSLMATSILVK